MHGICLVGTGVIAVQHVKAFAESGRVRRRWVVGSSPEKAKTFAREWQFERAGERLDEALADPAVELVIVASPSALHAEQALQSIRAGKNVIVEIPVGVSLDEAEEVARAADEAGVRVLACHTMRSFPAIREVRRRVQAGELDITQINGYFAIPRRRNQNQAGQRSWVDNLLWHHACHQVDAAAWVLGMPDVTEVSALWGRDHPRFGMAMDVSLQFATPTRQLVTQSLTYNTEQFAWELRFIGNEDTLTFQNGSLFNERGETLIAATSWVDLLAQNTRMLEALDSGQPCEYDIREILPAMKLLHLAQSSAEARQ